MLSKNIKKRLRKIIPLREYIIALIDIVHPRFFGQLGEDAVIANHIGWLGLPVNKKGAYVDIGAYHPTRKSNSYHFYRNGSAGYAVDIGNRKKKAWRVFRPRDNFINAAVIPNSWADKPVRFLMQNGYGQATDHIVGAGVEPTATGSPAGQVTVITASKLSEIITANVWWANAPWKFISIDIEGVDEKFVDDLDLEGLKPDVIAIESFLPENASAWDKMSYLANSCILVHNLRDRGYNLQSVCGRTLILVRMESKKR